MEFLIAIIIIFAILLAIVGIRNWLRWQRVKKMDFSVTEEEKSQFEKIIKEGFIRDAAGTFIRKQQEPVSGWVVYNLQGSILESGFKSKNDAQEWANKTGIGGRCKIKKA